MFDILSGIIISFIALQTKDYYLRYPDVSARLLHLIFIMDIITLYTFTNDNKRSLWIAMR